MNADDNTSKASNLLPFELLDKVAQTAKAMLPDSVSQELKETVRTALMQSLQELDVVTREEFDIQTKVLQKTRAKLEELERKVSEMEN